MELVSRPIASGVALVSVAFGIATLVIASRVTAQNPDEAPAPCRAQAVHALAAIEPAFLGHARKLSAKSPGTIEAAIWAYAPPKFHPVDEGALPSPIAGAKCPPDMALVFGRFCVDRYEGSIVVRSEGREVPHPHNVPPPDGSTGTVVAKSVAGVMPQGYITAKQAQGACRAAGKRLCQPVEWRTACAGSQGTAFPYGPTRVAGKCKDTGASPMLAYHAATMNRGWGATELNDPRNNLLEGGLAKTGAFPDCVNDFGAYDMVGNLHEWTADPNGTFQGGYWLDTSQHGDGCAYRTISHTFDYRDYSTGFRCCADVTAP